MANLLQIQNKSKMIDMKVKELFVRIQKDYEQGVIKTETDYLYEIFHALQEFYSSIGQPSMTLRLADGPPYSQDYNSTMNEIYSDISTLYNESQFAVDGLNESFKQVEIDRQSLGNRVKKLEDKMKEVALKVNQPLQEIIFRDGFVDQTNFDKETVDDTIAALWTREGVITLAPVSAETYNEGVRIKILEGNGLPGNTHQVITVSGQIKFVGEDNLHIDLAEVVDQNSDTWFEYESFEVPAATLLATGNLGFSYKEDVRWTIEPNKPLRLLIEVELPYAKTVNWFSLSPFVPNDKGANSAIIKSIKVADGKGKVTEVVGSTEDFQEEKIFTFSQQKCKYIRLLIEQPIPYETNIGHLFYKELDQRNTNYMDRTREQPGKRINGTYPSVENLGVRYDPKTKVIIQPQGVQGEYLTGTEQRKQSLFSLPKASTGVQVGIEELIARRYMIGIRDLSISKYQFERTSEYRSVSFNSNKVMAGVTLTADYKVPVEFGEGDWVKFSISIDDGQTWHRIYTRGTTKAGTKIMYMFNSNTPQEGRIDSFGYIDSVDSIHDIRLKIELSRPATIPDSDYYTPIVTEYKLHVFTEGDE